MTAVRNEIARPQCFSVNALISVGFLFCATSGLAQLLPLGGSGGGTNYPPPDPPDPPDYGSNLWVRVDGIFTNTFTGIASNTEPDIQYEI